MKKLPQVKRVIILCVVILLVLVSINNNDLDEELINSLKSVSESLLIQSPPPPSLSPVPVPVPTLVTVCCGYSRLEEAMVLFKSAISFTTGPLHLVAVTDHIHPMQIILEDLINAKPSHNITFLIIPPSLPPVLMDPPSIGSQYRCSQYRFFLASLLPTLDQVIYMDSDTILLQPLQVLWRRFSNMSSIQIIGAAEDNPLSPSFSYYNTSAILPFPSPTGFNSGILLLKLNAMRRSNFEEVYIILWKLTSRFLLFDDQDLLNLIAAYRPELFYTLEPQFNFTPLYCWIYNNILESEEKKIMTKVHVIHGVGGEFHPPSMAKTFYVILMHLKKLYRNKLYFFHIYNLLGTFKGPQVSALWDVTGHLGCRHRQIYQLIKNNQIDKIEQGRLNNNSYVNILCVAK